MPTSWLNAQVIVAATAGLVTIFCLYFSYRVLPRQMGRAYQDALNTLAAAVETKDSGTVGHARRVADYATAVARTFGVSGAELRRIEYAALLRDIGKVKIPHRVLNKTDPLTAEEWEIVKSHVALGAEMAASVPFLAHTADLIQHHHENWDGTGYPDGMAGEDIPLGSRILAVATDYDAMVSERPYHEPLSKQEAISSIRKGSGGKYDPKVVEIFLGFVEREPEQDA